MNNPKLSNEQPRPASARAYASVIVPGLGQFLAGRRGRGELIFLTTVVVGLLVNWALARQGVGKVTVGALTTTWLWLPLMLFWLWNIADSLAVTAGRSAGIGLGLLFIAIILYVIAWQFTRVRFDRLFGGFDAAQQVSTNLLNPDMVTISIGGEDQICAWKCLYAYAGDKLTGRTPQGLIRVSDNLLDIVGRVKPTRAGDMEMLLTGAKRGQVVTAFVAGSMIETIAMGLMATLFSTVLAVPFSFLAARNIMSRVRGGMVIYYVTRTMLNIVRAVDTFVWGLIVIVWVGLGPFAGVMALTIHGIAALGKLFSEEIEHIDPGPVEAVTATGASLIQQIRYAVVPQIIPSFLSYSLLRWDINMRSATVIGFVAGGGIGFFVIETVRMGGYQQYATALWAVAVVIVIVDYVSERWRNSILEDKPRETPSRQRTLRTILYSIIAVVVFMYCWEITNLSIRGLFNPGKNFGSVVLDFLELDLSRQVFQGAVQQMLVTIFQAMLATSLGAAAAFPFSFLAAKNLTGRSALLIWLYYAARAILNLLRSIEALLYVVIFVFWVGIGPFAGMLALAVTSFALIGKLFSEAIESIDTGPIEAITATGATRMQMISFAIVPQIVPPFVSYLLYQWDINVRMATIIGFAGGGGIGSTLYTYFNSLQYHKAGTVVALIVLVVALMDFASSKLRQNLV
ncbi:MAG TPA: phosphonate ABC transporter, permease protein PhnE [Anaerolineales bacterium]